MCGRYVALWSMVVYFPMCHMVWGGPGALMADAGVLDFAGGIVVHITAGIGALVGALMLGPRKDNVMSCSNIVLTFIGTGTTHDSPQNVRRVWRCWTLLNPDNTVVIPSVSLLGPYGRG